ncbi:Fungal specific transcription factor domain containing protein [Hyaloscypha variabilis]
MPFGKNHYVASLERRVVELEEFLAKKGLLDQGVVSPEPHVIAPSRRKDSSFSEIECRSSDSEEGESMVRILRDLSLETNGGYIGATSQITMGRLVGSIVKGKKHSIREEDLSPSPTYLPEKDDSAELRLSDISPDVADRLLVGYMKHIATRYPVLHSAWIRDLHSRRHCITNAYERSTLHLIYATAGRFLETTGETVPSYFPERHHAEVLKDLDEMLRYHDTRSVVTLLLLAVFSLRAKGGPGAWAYIGLAMRIAIDMGLHRHTAAMERIGFDVEMRKRLFWSCYTMDRQVSIPLGRPFSISDRDIDVQLPLDVDEHCQDLQLLEQASKVDPDVVRSESSSLTAVLHILRLRRIESSIQQTIYRVDQSTNVTDAEIEFYLDQLENWKKLIPLDAKKQVDRESIAFDGYDYYVRIPLFHLLLLYPLISKPRVNPRFLKRCAEVCGGVAQTYKRLHQTLSVGYSLMALQTVFMAGLTLIYCTWISPEEIFSSATSNDINACNIVLFVITERWPGAKKYRDAFEAIKQNVIDPLSEGKNNGPRHAVEFLKSIIPSTLPEVEMGEDRQEYSRIVTDMSGQDVDSALMQTFGGPAAVGMEQGAVSVWGCACDQEVIDVLNQWPPSGMDFSVGFEPFDLESYSVNMAEPFGGNLR